MVRLRPVSKRFTRLVTWTLSLLVIFPVFIKFSLQNRPRSVSLSSTELMDYDRVHIKQISAQVINYLYDHTDRSKVVWSRLAYVFYATSEISLCNCLVISKALAQYGTMAQMVILVTDDLEITPTIGKNLKEIGSKLKIKRVRRDETENKDSFWAASLTKMSVFDIPDFDRVIYMDSDAYLPNGHLDELFFLPPVDLAAAPAYWLMKGSFHDAWWESLMKLKKEGNWEPPVPLTHEEKHRWNQEQVYSSAGQYTNLWGHLPTHSTRSRKDLTDKESTKDINFYRSVYNSLPNFFYFNQFKLTSMLMVITPSQRLHQRVQDAFQSRSENDFDMELVNDLFKPIEIIRRQQGRMADQLDDIPDFLILPHQVYGMLTNELNMERHHQTFLADISDLPFIGRSEHLIGLKDESIPKGTAYYDFEDHVNQVDQWFSSVKYAHHSDWPVPKPWVPLQPNDQVLENRRRCHPFHEDVQLKKDPTNELWVNAVRPGFEATDCHAGEIWEELKTSFNEQRNQLCGV